MLRSCYLFFLVFFLAGCAHKSHLYHTKPIIVSKKITETRSFKQNFNDIAIAGRANVNIFTDSKSPSLVLRGDSLDLLHLKTLVSNGKLRISADKGYPKYPLTIDTHSRYLNAFTYKGQGTINAAALNSSLLDIDISNSGTAKFNGQINLHKISVYGPGYTEVRGIKSQNLVVTIQDNHRLQLIGEANISELNLKGNGNFGMYWVKSDQLTVRAKDRIFVQLAGIANRIDIELWGHAEFNGRYLRAKRLFVKTHDFAIAKVTALDRQHALALDASDIYFYNIPQMKSGFMGDAGAILDMREWNSYFMQDYNQYNK